MMHETDHCPLCGSSRLSFSSQEIVCRSCNIPIVSTGKKAPSLTNMFQTALSDDPFNESCGYLIQEDGLSKSIDIYRSLLNQDYEGLLVARVPPPRLMSKYGIDRGGIIWLTSALHESYRSIEPNAIPRISKAINHFMGSHEKCVILFSGLEYLITHNSFKTVLSLIQYLNDQLSMTRSIMIYTIDPVVLDNKQLHQVTKELEIYTPMDGLFSNSNTITSM